MDQINVFDLVARWLHIGSIVVLVGGTVFFRFLVMPAASSLPQVEHDELRKRIMARWGILVHVLIGLILVSGLYTLMTKAKTSIPLYHALVGVKILIALVIFFIASALVGRSKGLAPMRKNPNFWLGLNVALATVIILISGVVRFLPPKSAPAGVPAKAEVRDVAK